SRARRDFDASPKDRSDRDSTYSLRAASHREAGQEHRTGDRASVAVGEWPGHSWGLLGRPSTEPHSVLILGRTRDPLAASGAHRAPRAAREERRLIRRWAESAPPSP